MFVLRDVTDSRDLRPVREAFLAVLSHELRTPITTIYAGSSVLARRPALSPPATQTLAHDISAEAARLYDLVEDLLVLARLERRVLDPLDEPVLLQRSVDRTIRTDRGSPRRHRRSSAAATTTCRRSTATQPTSSRPAETSSWPRSRLRSPSRIAGSSSNVRTDRPPAR